MTAFVIADPGADHMGSLDRMVMAIRAAKDAGADAIKPQLYRADSIYAPGVRAEQQYGPEDLRDIIRRYEMPLEWLPVLKGYADAIGIEFMCSAFSKELYDAVDPYVKRHKIASLEAGDADLVRHVIAYGKPVIISTGSATTEEVFALREEAPGATLLQCTTAYPAPVGESDLRAIGVILDGFSDHTESLISGAVAVARGATVVEKHITLGDETSRSSPDYRHSFDPQDFKEYVANIREAELLLGTQSKTTRPSERELRPLRRTNGKLRGAA